MNKHIDEERSACNEPVADDYPMQPADAERGSTWVIYGYCNLGYVVQVWESKKGGTPEIIDSHQAGNNRYDSSQYEIEGSPAAVPPQELAANAFNTANEMAQEHFTNQVERCEDLTNELIEELGGEKTKAETYEVTWTAKFRTTIHVQPGEDVDDAISDIDVDNGNYVMDSFEEVTRRKLVTRGELRAEIEKGT